MKGPTKYRDISWNLLTITFLIFISVLSISGCKVDVQQSNNVMRRKEQQFVSIPCSLNITSCPGHGPDKLSISWYVFRKDSQHQLDLTNHSVKYTLEDQNLKINSLSTQDCGVYYCAAALLDVAHNGAQAIGKGTTLKVSKRGFNTRQALLLTLLVLLIVYSLHVLGILICIKTGQIKSVFKRRRQQSEMKDSAKQVIFSGVVQELCKRNLSDKIRAQYKVSQEKYPQTQDKSEDIYQNLDE
ncbi:immunoglobulin superfamily member 6 [Xyrauchen texanus]|uniref:immunoglobulin superfamily member 6 n=1 Tax=Xyrauchen texanus TaxID=154827 RepID=UPI0022426D6A|nr:immunoglobulin superfamily member 6 [Xyrauchen texanus]